MNYINNIFDSQMCHNVVNFLDYLSNDLIYRFVDHISYGKIFNFDKFFKDSDTHQISNAMHHASGYLNINPEFFL
ncbi:putative ORFan [Cotonvirus japonicus]|uniref:ORFan n=1 Tax=Cotonvirus japonicus TaxID=2811091 RepID=A0ABM7NR47_9VIRU|nr:putative ORFan [Cotonvirus japonicus]BCS82630.1 putative ORFan [Cotonvirus japonicus]